MLCIEFGYRVEFKELIYYSLIARHGKDWLMTYDITDNTYASYKLSESIQETNLLRIC